MVGEGILQWIRDRLDENRRINAAVDGIKAQESVESLDAFYAALPDDVRNFVSVKDRYSSMKIIIGAREKDKDDLLTGFIRDSLDSWVKKTEAIGGASPENAKQKLAEISAEVVRIAGVSAAIDYGLGLAPNGLGAASSTNTKHMLTWLGFGAILAAVAHDPVKIGVLRPYQDSLEATFRNKRPDHVEVLKAFQQRSLSPTRIDDVDKIDDALMNQVEKENSDELDKEMAKHGYNQKFIDVMKDAETKALTFSNLAQLARMGHYSRPLATFSLWGYGLDRRLMKAALDTLDRMNASSQYEGFRALVEPSYVDGSIDEAELTQYWDKIRVPKDVQGWVLPRLRKSREKALAKLSGSPTTKERDLTISQLSSAYIDGLMTREKAKDDIIRLGYDATETEILLSIADTRKKTPSAAKLKRLPLSDYEKAYKAKLISLDAVLTRMKDEYDPRDVTLEKQLLEIGKA